MSKAKVTIPKHYTPDDQWIHQHLEDLVDKHAGKYVVVAGGETFIGRDAVLLEKEARKKHPGIIPSGMPIPHPEDFTCAL